MARWNGSRAGALAAGLMAVVAAASLPAAAQISTNRVEGLRDQTPRLHALTNARIVLAPGKEIANGTLVMRDGLIVAVGKDIPVPEGARIWKLEGRSVYAGFVDMASTLGVPSQLRQAAPPSSGPRRLSTGAPSDQRTPLSGRTLASANRNVHPEQDLAQQLEVRADDVKAVRELGFTSVLAAPAQGVFRGQSALLNTADIAPGRDTKSLVLAERVAQHLANEVDRSSSPSYPSSLMGAIALVRQTLYDARWHLRAMQAKASTGTERPEANASLEALAALLDRRQPAIYKTDNEQDFQRIAKVRDEFGLRVLLQGNGFEYRRAAQLKHTAMPVIVPLNYPAVPEVENPDTALDASLQALQHWEQAPSNLALLQRSGVEFTVTATGLKDAKKDFWPHLREAVKRGLSADMALAALTTVPARLLGEPQRLGRLEPGHLANIVVAKGDLFTEDKAQIELVFVDGRSYALDAWGQFDPRGRWTITSPVGPSVWDVSGTPAKPILKVDGVSCELSLRAHQLLAHLPCGATANDTRLTVLADGRADQMRGTVQLGGGPLQPWSAVRTQAFAEPVAEPKPAPAVPSPKLAYPAGEFGITLPARPDAVLVRNATIWTSSGAGRLEQADMLVRAGKIVSVGKGLTAPTDAIVIDASGKHLTPGIIDAHSHTSIMDGVNEWTSSVTAEVRVGDALDATNINLYRELAGGVTAANLLHGSANTIGGQNQIIKLRWGADAEGLKFDGAMPGIKFALGENVKQANWGEGSTSRYPQTRMGVEQVLRDAFAAAASYRKAWNEWRKSPAGRVEPRRDLQLDTLVEILERKREVHIHSYRQDEILMFARLAKELGIKVAAFQHVLEGYKVADAIAEIGAGASTFSDWWAYKMEVVDAIPYNGVLMQSAGVLTSFNSDSDELARRMNTEAAKAVKYGGMSESDALALVTINPARQLRIDGRVGSIEPGKDADFVIWNGHPLSSLSRAEQTWIEGRRYFDLASDMALRLEAITERQRLIAKALPLRLAAMKTPERTGSAGKAADKSDAAPPSEEALRYLELQRILAHAALHRFGYASGTAQHNCTEEFR